MFYNVLSEIKHNGELYQKGSQINLSAEEATSLLKDKVLEEIATEETQIAEPETVAKAEAKLEMKVPKKRGRKPKK